MRYHQAMPSFDVCNAARLRRDPRYDGRFFTAVKTTGIYCRPVCPAKQPLTRNVVYYPTAAAAEAAGFRPCLRCRPETAPFCPAWNGTRSTVARAVKLINEGALDEDSVVSLALRLGISSRHLARLFERHVGATPQQLAKTLRVQRAKRLLDSGDHTMIEIAFQAGFGSLRRFNAAFASSTAARRRACAYPSVRSRQKNPGLRSSPYVRLSTNTNNAAAANIARCLTMNSRGEVLATTAFCATGMTAPV